MLATPGVVQKFLSDPEAVKRVTATFAGQYTLDVVRPGATVSASLKNKFYDRPILIMPTPGKRYLY